MITDHESANDISKNSFNMFRVRKTLAGAHEILSATAFMRGRILTAKERGEYINLGGSLRKTYDNPSILSSVMGVTQEVRGLLVVPTSNTHNE